MQNIIHDLTSAVEDMLYGYVKSHPLPGSHAPTTHVCLKYAGAPVAGKVGIVTGGGSGHKPAFVGYISNT